MNPLRVGVVGYGYWGKNISRVFHQSPHFVLSVICDSNTSLESSIKKYYPGTVFTKNLDLMLQLVDVVAVITPVESHFFLAKKCLEMGKHVLVTKPLTARLNETNELLRLAHKVDRCLFADHTFVFHPAVRALKDLLPRIGTPYFISSQRMNLGLYQSDVNVILDLMPHDISIVSYLFDTSITKAQTNAVFAAGLPQEDFAHTTFETQGGIKGMITVSWLSPSKIRQFFVVGSKGMLVYDDNLLSEKVKFIDQGISLKELKDPQNEKVYTARISYRNGDLFAPAISNTEALSFEIQEFHKSIFDFGLRNYYENLNLMIMKGLHSVLNNDDFVEKNTPRIEV